MDFCNFLSWRAVYPTVVSLRGFIPARWGCCYLSEYVPLMIKPPPLRRGLDDWWVYDQKNFNLQQIMLIINVPDSFRPEMLT